MRTSEIDSEVTGVLLAGGRSSRMGGREKALLDIGGKPMLLHVLARLRPQVGRIVINANGDPARFSGHCLPVIADSIEGYAGPLAGLHAGIEWARAETPDAKFIASVPSAYKIKTNNAAKNKPRGKVRLGSRTEFANVGITSTPAIANMISDNDDKLSVRL